MSKTTIVIFSTLLILASSSLGAINVDVGDRVSEYLPIDSNSSTPPSSTGSAPSGDGSGIKITNCGLDSQFTVSAVELNPTTAVPGQSQTVKINGTSTLTGTITSVQQSVYQSGTFLSTQQMDVNEAITAGDSSTLTYSFQFPSTGAGTYSLHVAPEASGTQVCCVSFDITVS